MRKQSVIVLACFLCFIVGWFSGHSPVERAAKVNMLFKTVKETVTETLANELRGKGLLQ